MSEEISWENAFEVLRNRVKPAVPLRRVMQCGGLTAEVKAFRDLQAIRVPTSC